MNNPKLITLSILIIFLFLIACSEDNRIIISSIDGSQTYTKKVEIDTIFQNSKIDTTRLKNLINKDKFSPLSYNEYIKPDTNNSQVFIIRTKRYGYENEETLLLVCSFQNKKLSNLFYIELEQAIWYWEKYKGESLIKDNFIFIDSVFESIGFALSCAIKFPYNKDGLYDNIKRYMRIKAKVKFK